MTKEVAETWMFIETESLRRKQLLRDEEIRAQIEKSKPRSKKARKIKPWESLGSEVRLLGTGYGAMVVHVMRRQAKPEIQGYLCISTRCKYPLGAVFSYWHLL